MHSPIPASALKHLEPYPGGSWTVSGETADSVTVSYSGENNAEIVSYTLHRCETEEDVLKQCQPFLYTLDLMTSEERATNEKLSEQNTKLPEPMASTIELKIEPLDNTAWTPVPVALNDFNAYQTPADSQFPFPTQGNQSVLQSTADYTLSSPASFTFQSQFPATYNEGSFLPINSYWPIQNEFGDLQGDFSTQDVHSAPGEHGWIQDETWSFHN
ncbi:hypothetical protein NLG97_g6063 [Lecanicillium saksenae]|uniref:Uncharacterized protein n=1 Tax=Lecanicillium saksenae TaxID=468837 RepID=A0ACC1QSE4_9HYPO|nr:hypothetical protein NLG97_g6063 [Lecanicillium saksenae]